ncbi:solute carrier family 10 (sodium/bile acid cotransporter), member 7 [Sphingobium sp. AP50]|uniref:bile acid:sodium symporter family protein n=1 Tax=Sphingobium sp. AP50 TaxID=1884369 RepID=UPI0008C241C1|nr:bile acid:sodium symporter family protein [Sphingobium sp. AP50]SEJ26812.1 solute carrier family 10 (sodium/bile acid cotransporter), member 7 [Sphingobium sp. AP50]
MQRPSLAPLRIDPFLLWLIATVAGASLLPVRGSAATLVDILADCAIALLFFLHGAKLSRDAIRQGAGNWRLHLLVFASTYILFPIVGVTLALLMRGWVDPVLASGLLYLTLLPSTVQSSIAFTAIAGGNVAAAVCSASLSNLIGIVLTPLLVALALHVDGNGGSAALHSIQSIALQLLLPFVAGHLLRPLIGGFIDRNKGILAPVDRGSILLVVYSAFSAAVVGGIWTQVGISDLLILLALSSLILTIVMSANIGVARLFRLPREDAIVLLFCGSKKSLVSGVPMAGALFPAAQVGPLILPLMIFHQLQLFLCAALAMRFRRQQENSPPLTALPRTEAEISSAAATIGLPIDPACMPGIVANMALLDRHAGIMLASGGKGAA